MIAYSTLDMCVHVLILSISNTFLHLMQCLAFSFGSLWILSEGQKETLRTHITHKKVRAVLIAVLLLVNIVVARLPGIDLDVGSVGT